MSDAANQQGTEAGKKERFNARTAHILLARLIRQQAPGLASNLQPVARDYVDYVESFTAEEKADG